MIRRRQLLATALLPSLSWAALPAAGERRLVFVILRGGMDGLMAAPVPGDPDWLAARGLLADLGAPPLPLAGPFALHPLLPELHAMYGRGELVLVHAAGIPYKERSHFDAQQVLESGGTHPHELGTGWLGRALAVLDGRRAVALETAVPLALRGAQAVDTWAPSRLPEPAADLVTRLAAMYAGDPPLAQALERARAVQAQGTMADLPSGRDAALGLAQQAADFLQRGASVAVLELGGWDSHAQQLAPQGATLQRLRTLDAMLAALRSGLQAGGTWAKTAVLVATEFGREVQPNGSAGTDHGSGGAAFVLGGAVAGGRVIADWPGLQKKDRYEGRDLRITTDLRSLQHALLAEHLGVPRRVLAESVLPGSVPLAGLTLLR